MRFFSYDGDGYGFEEHETEEFARAAAESAIVYATEDGDGYDESAVDQICYGLILGRAEITNRRDLTDDERENHPDWCFYGEPKLVPLEAPIDDAAVLLADALLLVMDGEHFRGCPRGRYSGEDCSKVCCEIRAALDKAGR